MKFSVDVQTESFMSYKSFGAKAILWDIQVINVKSNLFNNSSAYERHTELSKNDTENLINISGYNDQRNLSCKAEICWWTSED